MNNGYVGNIWVSKASTVKGGQRMREMCHVKVVCCHLDIHDVV